MIIGQSQAILAVHKLIERMAGCDVPVLIEGETGTGKELVARAIHLSSARGSRAFVPVNCGALPEALVESEFFGHRRGAFTGATDDWPGIVRLAEEGTIFLDEIDALPQRGQVALLRFLQDFRFRPLGSESERTAKVRIIAASNKHLRQEAKCGAFRLDLFFRLNVVSIELPPLRERPGDIRLLASQFLADCVARYRRPPNTLSAATVTWFETYDWPGNVRELENCIHREYLLCDDIVLDIPPATAGSACVLKARADTSAETAATAPADFLTPYSRARESALLVFNKSYLSQLLNQTCGNVTRAADLAGKERRALGKLLKRYQVSPEVFRH